MTLALPIDVGPEMLISVKTCKNDTMHLLQTRQSICQYNSIVEADYDGAVQRKEFISTEKLAE